MIIRLFCAGGFSTSVLVKKMEEAAEKKGNGNQFDNKLLGIKFWMDSKKEVSYGF